VLHGEFVVRREDFESYARELSDGYDRIEATPLMTIPGLTSLKNRSALRLSNGRSSTSSTARTPIVA